MNFISFGFIFTAIVLLAYFIFWVFSFIVLYHLDRFGVGVQPKNIAAIFFLGSVILFSINILLFANLDSNSIGQRFEKVSSSLFSIKNQK